MNVPAFRELARTTLTVLLIAGMIVAAFAVVRPFLPAATWAVMIVVATWPLMLRVQSALGGRRGLAVAVMTIALLLGLIVPLGVALVMIVARASDIADWFQSLVTWSVPPPPDWLGRLPLVGPRLVARWTEAMGTNSDELSARLAPYARQGLGWFVSLVGSIGLILVQFLLIVLFAAITYASGEKAADGVRRFARRLGGAAGEHSARIAAQAIRGVALGIIVTALVQTGLAAIGLFVAGVPLPGVLSALVFVLSIAQLGPALVLIPVVVWAYWSGSTAWATALLLWTLLTCSIDNVLRPALIRKGANLPLLLIFLGVAGGMLAFGVIGIFVGPVVLAVGYSLLADWVDATGVATAAPAAPAGEKAFAGLRHTT
jgi:predicted PurR-regulated permease PerM